GGLENIPDSAALMAMPPEQVLAINDINLNLDWQASLLPEAVQPQLLPLEEAGVIRREDHRWRLAFSARQGQLSLNGRPLSLEDMQMLVLSLRPQQDGQQAAGADEMAERYGWYNEYDRLATLV